jgi:hypothetical protein
MSERDVTVAWIEISLPQNVYENPPLCPTYPCSCITLIIVGKGNTCLLAPNNNNTAATPFPSHLASDPLRDTRRVELNFSDGVMKTIETRESAM